MNLAVWAERNGVARVTAYRWFRGGLLLMPVQRVGRLILVDEPIGASGRRSRRAVYARVSSVDQKADLDRQVARATAWAATAGQIPVDKVVVEVGSALNGHRRKFIALLCDPAVNRIVVEHRDRFCRFGSEDVEAALAAQSRALVDASVRVLVQRPPQPAVAQPDSRVGVDVGVRRPATVAAAAGEVLERVPNPRPLDAALRQLWQVSRARSRCVKGSRRHRERSTELSRLHRRVNDVRSHHLHVLTTRLAKTRGRIVVEGLDAAGMLRHKGLSGARARRRGLADAALGTPRRHLSYKTRCYGSQLVVADRWFPSSKTCHACGHVQDIGRDEKWHCGGCSAIQQRDDNAAINLARYGETSGVVGPVGAAVKRGADPKTRPGRAGGCEARKGRSHPAAEQPRDGVQVA